ncbi:AMP-binding protein, partial [Pyxidicoccus sp. 3LG]
MSQPRTLIDLLEERSLTRAEHHLYTFLEDGTGEGEGTRLTRGELSLRARRIGAALQALASAGER